MDYHRFRMILSFDNPRPVIEPPVYDIDVKMSSRSLDIQEKFGVEREARHLSSVIYDYSEIQRF